MRSRKLHFVAAAVALLSGCWTCGRPPFDLDLLSQLDGGKPRDPVFWNFWALATDSVSVKPLETVAAGSRIELLVDLSTVSSGQLPVPVKAGPRLVDFVKGRRERGFKEEKLNLVVIPDTASFAEAPFASRLEVDLLKLEQLLERPEKLPSRVETFTASKAYSVGRTTVRLSVREKANGRAPVTFSVWNADWTVPLDDFQVVLQIGGSAPFLGASSAPSLGWFDVLRPGAAPPDGAIHFLAPDDATPVQAIFRDRRAPDRFDLWSLRQPPEPMTAKELTATLEAISQHLGDPKSGAAMVQGGRALHDLLFPGKGADALKRFLADRKERPTLYVRTLNPGSTAPLAAPLAFVCSETGGFLGDAVKLETPLEVSPPAATQKCISRWKLLLPPNFTYAGGDAMQLIRDQIGVAATPPGPLVAWGGPTGEPNTVLPAFQQWISDGTSTEPTVLVIASHQADGEFWFVPDQKIHHALFRRTFQAPSIAVLAGCETGGPKANELIRRFNKLNFTSIIATSAPAHGSVLGRFLDLFAEEVANAPGAAIGASFDGAVEKLRRDMSGGKELAPRALQFTLLGDRSVPVCPP